MRTRDVEYLMSAKPAKNFTARDILFLRDLLA